MAKKKKISTSSFWFQKHGAFLVVIALVLTIPLTISLSQKKQSVEQAVAGAAIDPASGNPQPNGQTAGWHLVFSDEFNANELDLTKWIMCNPSFASSCNPYNNEEEKFNTAATGNKNVVVSGGQLHLIATKEGGQVWSGMVSTGPDKFGYNNPGYQSFQFTYGYYEGRVKMPKGNGFWPSMWMLPDQDKYGAWPDSGEYDVVEIPGNNPTEYHFTAHWAGGGQCGHACTPQQATVADTSADYHTFGYDWEPEGLTWYFDGKKMGDTVTDAAAIKKTPFYIIANFSVGGSWGPLNGGTDGSTPFPASMDIDYLRVWQKGAAAENPPPAATTAPIATVAPTVVTPTLYCLGSCPTVAPEAATIAPTLGTEPNLGVGNPTETPAATEPTEDPCAAQTNTVGVQTYDHDNNGDSGGGDSSGNFFEQLLQLLKQLIELIKQLLGGGSPTTPTQPGTPAPTPCPTE